MYDKWIISVFLSVFLFSGGLSAANFIRGDTNQDGSHDISDAVNSLTYLFAGATNTCIDALDANDDGSCDISDTVFLLSYLFAGGDDPTAPFPGCGSDPTADSISCDAFNTAICEPAPPCMSGDEIQALINSYISEPICIESPAWEGEVPLVGTVVACPEGCCTCGDGTAGCEVMLGDVDTDIDFPNQRATSEIEGDTALPIKAGSTTCDTDITYTGNAVLTFTLTDTQWEGVYEITSIDTLEITIDSLDLSASGGLVCLLLPGASDLLKDTLNEELNNYSEDFLQGLREELVGQYVCY